MKSNYILFKNKQFPPLLKQIPDPPEGIFTKSNDFGILLARPMVALVGSRKVSAYGKLVTSQLAAGLARAGVVVVSGLAIGVDGIAHRAVLEAGGQTIAVLPASLDRVYPTSHTQLAQNILEQGGALISEYPPGTTPYPVNFIARNRLVSGISRAVLITEASEKSGTLHTARFALEQGKDVLVVPGNITSPTSIGTNNLLKVGATPVTGIQDVLYVLGIDGSQAARPIGDTPRQQAVLDLLWSGQTDGVALQQASKLDVPEFNQIITLLEITGKVRALGGNQWSLQ